MQHFKLVNWWNRGFAFWCQEQVIRFVSIFSNTQNRGNLFSFSTEKHWWKIREKKWLELNRHRTWEILWVEKMWMQWQWTWMARVDLDLLPDTRLICLKSTWLVANLMSLWFRMLLILWTLPPLLDLLKTINGMISFDISHHNSKFDIYIFSLSSAILY